MKEIKTNSISWESNLKDLIVRSNEVIIRFDKLALNRVGNDITTQSLHYRYKIETSLELQSLVS